MTSFALHPFFAEKQLISETPAQLTTFFKHPAISVCIDRCARPGSEITERIKAFIRLKGGYEGKVPPDKIFEFYEDKCPPYAV